MHSDTPPTPKQAAVRVTLIGAALDLTLGILKVLVGLLAGSVALVSDGIHSFSDLITDAFVLLIARISHEKPDREHPYGHRRFETLGTIVIGVGLFVVAGLICADSLRRLAQQQLPVPGPAALAVALASIAGKEWIFRYTRKVARDINSSMLLANAWHSRTDALSSIAVLVGLLGAMLGYAWMDLLAALVVGVMIAHIAWKLLYGSLSELVDTALPPEQVEEIRDHILGLTGIDGVHELRSRGHGGQVFLDIHVQVDSKISVSEGHYLGDRLTRSLRAQFPQVADVIVHIDPELDTDAPADATLPLRGQVEAGLLKRWEGLLTPQDIERFDLHYLREKVQVEVYLRDYLDDERKLATLREAVEDLQWLESVRFYARC